MKILICVPVFNRKKVTQLALENLQKYKQDADLWVYNDWSTEYDNDFLEPLCDKVIKLPESNKLAVKNEENVKGMGVQHLRWHQFREFAKMDKYDAVYFTDSDAIHDPEFITALKTLHSGFSLENGAKLPVCLYNAKNHIKSTIEDFEYVSIRGTAPGISQLFSKDMCRKITSVLDSQPEDPDYAWDYKCLEYLELPVLNTKTSYLEHFGAVENSMHTFAGDWDRDRAVNPTKYLKDTREGIIAYLENRSEKPAI